MTGESPDKSEQRKSSGGAAPGESDPRLAVLRERAASADAPAERSEPEAEAAPEERVDQPTAVFKMPEEPAAEPGTDPTPEPESSETAEPPENDARLRAAVAAWVATADPTDSEDGRAAADPTPLPEPVPDTPDAERAPSPNAAPAGAPDVVAAEPGAETDETGPTPGTAAGTADADAKDERATESAGAEAGTPDDAAAEAQGDADGSGAGQDGDPAAHDEDHQDHQDHQDDEGDRGATRDDTSDDAAEADAAEAGTAEPGLTSANDAVAADTHPAGGGAEGSGARGGVDQATAVFKAVRPRKAVDQPTTALKVPSEPETKPEPKPETAAERTSQFVPLKRDDARPVPPTAKNPTGAPEAPAPEAPAVPAPASATTAPASAPAAVSEPERTRQQPLPPLPPLDLLAELTNTPPKRETPVRTAVRRVKIWTPLVLLLVILFAVAQFLRPLPAPELTLTATPTYTFEGGDLALPWPGEGQSAVDVQGVGSMGTEGEQKPAPIASMAKAMTAYVILKEHPLKGAENGPKITVDQQGEDDAKKADESVAQITEGQQFTERQMIQLLMIPSGNNVARLLARWDATSEEAFVKKMNDAAKDLGMTNSTYTDPSGFEKTTVSTPADQLKLGKAVMQNDAFREIVNMPDAEIPGLPGKIYNNNNILLQPGVSGIKTGSSTPAGGNLLWTADTIVDGKERRIVGVVMGQQTGTTLDSKLQLAITNSLKLIQAAQQAVTSALVVKKGDVVGYVDDGLGGRAPVVATKDLKAVGWPGLKVELAISDGGKPLPHAAKAGDAVGQVTVGTGPGQVRAPVALQKDLVEPGFGDKLTRVG